MALFRQSTIEQILECPICMETFVKPKVLPCQHSFCLECLYKSYNDNVSLNKNYQLICPICREIYQLKRPKSFRPFIIDDLDGRLQNHFVLTSLLEAKIENLQRKKTVKRTVSIYFKDKPLITVKCFVCKTIRKWQCVTCDKGFCNTCVSDHFELIPNHEIFDLETQILCETKKLAVNNVSVPCVSDTTTCDPSKITNNKLQHVVSTGSTVTGDISWKDYTKNLFDSETCITRAIIANSSTADVWWQYSKNPLHSLACTKEELKAIVQGNDILANGFSLESVKYDVKLVEKNVVFGKCCNGGVFALKTDKTVILAFFLGDINESRHARGVTEKVGLYLSKNGL